MLLLVIFFAEVHFFLHNFCKILLISAFFVHEELENRKAKTVKESAGLGSLSTSRLVELN